MNLDPRPLGHLFHRERGWGIVNGERAINERTRVGNQSKRGERQRNGDDAQNVGKLVKSRLVKNKCIENKFLHLFNFNSNTLL